MLKCKDCNASSAFIMLLVIICEKMMFMFERLLQGVRQPSEQQQNAQPSSSPTLVTSKPGESPIPGGGPGISLGVYKVDLAEERCSLIRVLILFQIKNLEGLLTQLISIATMWNWTSQMSNLQTLTKRSRDIASLVRVINSG